MPIVKFIVKWGIILGVLVAIGFAAFFAYYYQDIPDIKSLEIVSDKQVVRVNFSNDERITTFGDLYNDQVKFYELPQNLVNAVLATEDRKFFNHFGIDIVAIIRASYVNHKAGRIVQGASTITQQLAKLLFLKPEKTFKRKIQEVILAFKLEKRFTKEQIFTAYLNHAYFGSGNYGVLAAAKFYFHKEVAKLDLHESAMLAGLLKAPSKLSPKNSQDSSESRTNAVLSKMIDAGFLNEKNLSELNSDISYQTTRSQSLYFADFVNGQFADFITKKDNEKKIISVTTTLNQKVQNILEDVANQFVDANEKKLNAAQISVIIMDKNGAVLGMTGGKDYQKSQYNRAMFAKRQAGSAFKTFVYLTAFEKGYKPEDVFEDKKINIGAWLPDNYDGKYFGKTTLKNAFANSLNSISIQLAQKIDRKDIAKIANKLGITSAINKNDLTIALGTTELTLYELTSAYTSIANEGRPIIPYVISDIKDENGDLLYTRESSGFKSVLSDDSKKYIKEVLRAVVENGTGKKANVAPDIFGKTGTSQNFHDAWFIGFNDNYVIGVWIGNDDNSATNKITGGSLPAELFAEIIKKL